MDLKKLFTTRKFGLTLDEFFAIGVAVAFATVASDTLFPMDSQWARFAIFCAGWLVGFLLYSIIKAFIIIQYEKRHPEEKPKD